MATTKLTAVSLTFKGVKIQAILPLPVDPETGAVHLPTNILNKMLTEIGCIYRGQTYTVGGQQTIHLLPEATSRDTYAG